MELIIEERGKGFGKVHQARIAEIRRHLKTMTSREDAESLQALADALLVYSHSHVLLKRSSKELLEWLKSSLIFFAIAMKRLRLLPSNLRTPDPPFFWSTHRMSHIWLIH